MTLPKHTTAPVELTSYDEPGRTRLIYKDEIRSGIVEVDEEAVRYERGKGRWWLPWAFLGGMAVVWLVLKGLGVG